jgi:hypothetical protein
MLDGRGLFAASESVTREEWAAYVSAATLNVATLAYRQ